jgi:MoCo/4Fe-4S cofactor protein with predicted Tat translocation signal
MSTQDQCPSTAKPGATQLASRAELAATTRSLAGTVNGRIAFRSPEELADTPDFRDFVEREFPAGSSELLESSRRTFLQVMGASIALAGAATIPGCRRPDHKILSYSKNVPEDIIPGKPLYYATSMPLPGGGAEGLLVETHTGRPTKLEGNPLHPISQGKSSVWAQAAILGLYDPDRLKYPMYRKDGVSREATYDDFTGWAPAHFKKFDASGGKGLAFVVQKKNSVTRDVIRDRIKARWKDASWIPYEAIESLNALRGNMIAFNAPLREELNLRDARVILSLDRDFLTGEQASLAHARDFAHTRRCLSDDEGAWSKGEERMSRLYVVESGFSVTGSAADHRTRLAPSRIVAFAVELAKFMVGKLGAKDSAPLVDALKAIDVNTDGIDTKKFLPVCATDLLDTANREYAAVLAGPGLPPEVHAIVAAINSIIGTKIVSYRPVSADDASDSAAALKSLAERIAKGEIDTLVCVETNPAYDAPGELGFAALLAKVPTVVTLSVGASETAAASTWSLNGAHFLESWGDTTAADGSVAPVQPMIAPLYEPAMSDIELLSFITDGTTDGHEIVRGVWRERLKGKDFDRLWRIALHDGIVAGTATPAERPACRFDEVARAIGAIKLAPAPTSSSLDVVFAPGRLHDGRFANVAWLQELPQTGTRIVWDNPILLSPKTATKLGVWERDSHPFTDDKYPRATMAEIAINGRKVKCAAWILPGMADDTVIVTLGYGRRTTGVVGDGVGFDCYPLRDASGDLYARGATVAKTDGEYWIASTQNHWTLEGRNALLRAVDLPAWQKHGKSTRPNVDTMYPHQQAGKLNFAEKLGELSHTPPNISVYNNPLNDSSTDAAPSSQYSSRPQWGMTIDLSTCVGCDACTIACQAENNIPVVGKKEVAKGREMTWIRVDRYFTGTDDGAAEDVLNNPDAMYHQPVACVHCENAPCETVCPVNATVHGPEGLNYMTYNRCIGTRYCANNCPYKVRRFNFFDYGVTRFNGGYLGREAVESVIAAVPFDQTGNGSTVHNKLNPNLIPPRLREKVEEISRMQKNPDVTVRSRGVMEKCSYCIQRINAARVECNLRGDLSPELKHKVPDGFFQVACQQACPSGAITFGDILDAESKVSKTRAHGRSYMLLGYLNTRPRTSHMLRVSNPHPELVTDERKHSWEDPFHHGGSHGDGHKGEHDNHSHGKPDEHSFIDPRKAREDGGYALSLRVLSAGASA